MEENLETAAGVREGDVLAGKYRIEKVLGVGGMGVVVAARHIQLETKVAIKFLLPSMLSNKEAVGRFAREARAAVRITGEHVARVHDVSTLENGAPYMVMEFLEGSDLSGWLHQRGTLPIEQAVEFVLHACIAVAEAHKLGIVHRDLKPANLFCIRRADGRPSVKVLDFGISKVTDPGTSDSGMSVTKTTAMMGSPLYMSPEQMTAPKEVDAQTDVWALGIILFELVTGQVPFGGETLPEVAIKIATQPTPPLRSLRPDASDALEAAIRGALEKPKNRRFKNVAQLAIALQPVAPPSCRALIERICGILDVASPASMAPPASTGPSAFAPTQITGGIGGDMRASVPDGMGGGMRASAPDGMGGGVTGGMGGGMTGTMTGVGRTTGGMAAAGGGKKVIAFGVLGAVTLVGVIALGMSLRAKQSKPDETMNAARFPTPAVDAIPAAPTATAVAAPPLAPDPVPTIATVPVATPEGPKAGRGKGPPARLAQNPAPPPAGHPNVAPPAPPPVAPPPAPAAAPAPPKPKNPMDLGGFQ